MIKSFASILYDANEDVQDLTLKALNHGSVVEQYTNRIDEIKAERDKVTKQRDEAEDIVARLREKAKEDRAGYAELRKQQSEEKKQILEQCVAEKEKADELLVKVQELEKEKEENEAKCDKAAKLITINTTLCQNLTKWESAKCQLSQENQDLRNENTALTKRNLALSKESDGLSAINTQWEEDSKQAMKDKIESDAVIQHLNAQLDKRDVDLRDLGNRVELWRQDVVHHQETIEQQKHDITMF